MTLTASESADSVNLGYGGGTNGTLDLGSNTLTLPAAFGQLVLGYDGGVGSIQEGAGGSFTAASAIVFNGNSLRFGANDSVGYLALNNGSSATTAATGNVTQNIDVYTGSTLNVGANLNLSGYLNVQDSGSVLNMNGRSISANSIELGYNGSSAVTILNPGTFTAAGIALGNGTNYTFLSTDSATYISVFTGSTLNLGANLNNLSTNLSIADSGSVLNMNGYSVSAYSVGFGTGVAIQNQGTITANMFGVGINYTFLPTDSVNTASVSTGGTLTTSATGNITGYAEAFSGGTLNLGANLNLTGYLDVDLGGTVNAQGYAITANGLSVGFNGTATLLNAGPVQVGDELFIGHGSALTLHGGDVVNNFISLTGGSTLNVQQTGGTGLTLNGAYTGALAIDSSTSSTMDLIFAGHSGWDFRWADPTGNNWISTIDGMIAAGQIEITNGSGYQVYDSGGYTYVGFQSASIPEPSSLILAGLASVGVAFGMMWQTRRTSR